MKPSVAVAISILFLSSAQAEVIGVFFKDDFTIQINSESTGACATRKDQVWRNAAQKTIWGNMPACWSIDKEIVAVCPVERGKMETRVCMFISEKKFRSPR